MNVESDTVPAWLEPVWSSLAQSIARQRLAHALLMVGPRGIGKRMLALRLARALACERPEGANACGRCRSCRQVRVGSQPNATVLTADGHHGLVTGGGEGDATPLPLWTPPSERKRQDISIDAVRDLIERLSLTAHYGATKVAVINPADALNAAGVNALLKTIEEPPPKTYLLLVSERWRALPATLRSRCQLVRCPSPDAVQGQAWLEARTPGVDFSAVPQRLRMPLAATDSIAPDSDDWDQALTELCAGRRSPLALASGISRDEARRRLETWMHRAVQWQWSLLADAEGPQPPSGVTTAALTGLIRDLVEAVRRLERNVSPAMLMESVMIRWSRAPDGSDAAHRTN